MKTHRDRKIAGKSGLVNYRFCFNDQYALPGRQGDNIGE